MKPNLNSRNTPRPGASARDFLLVVLIASFPTAAKAQTALAWKLKSGETLSVEMTQHTESRVGFSSKSADTKIDLHLRLTWFVQDVSTDAIQIKQTIDQVRATFSGTGGTAEFDSASKARVIGPAKQLADSMRPLVGAQFEIVFTPQGEVKSAKPLNDAAQSLLAGSDKSSDSSVSSLKQLASQAIVPLPEQPVAVGDKWTATSTLQSGPGPHQHETTYAFAELRDDNAAQVARISITGRLLEEPLQGQKSPTQLRVKAHEQTGSILFAVDTGRPTLVEQTQQLKTERTYRDTTIEVTLDSKLKMTFAKTTSTD